MMVEHTLTELAPLSVETTDRASGLLTDVYLISKGLEKPGERYCVAMMCRCGQATATEIAHACNAHDELVAALEDAIGFVARQMTDRPTWLGPDPELTALRDKLCAALAKAKP